MVGCVLLPTGNALCKMCTFHTPFNDLTRHRCSDKFGAAGWFDVRDTCGDARSLLFGSSSRSAHGERRMFWATFPNLEVAEMKLRPG